MITVGKWLRREFPINPDITDAIIAGKRWPKHLSFVDWPVSSEGERFDVVSIAETENDYPVGANLTLAGDGCALPVRETQDRLLAKFPGHF